MYYITRESATALQPHVLLTGIRRLLVSGRGRLAFANANHCQGQLQIPQSLSVVVFTPGLCSIVWWNSCSLEKNGKGVRSSCHHGKVALKLLCLRDRPDAVYFFFCAVGICRPDKSQPILLIEFKDIHGSGEFGFVPSICSSFRCIAYLG
jgi:hypothetical protein